MILCPVLFYTAINTFINYIYFYFENKNVANICPEYFVHDCSKKLHYTKIVHLRHLTLVCENKAFSSQQFWNSKHLEYRLFELRTFDRTNIFHDRGWILILKCNTHYWIWFTAGTFHFAGMKSIYSFRITVTFVVWGLMVSLTSCHLHFFGLFKCTDNVHFQASLYYCDNYTPRVVYKA